VSNSTCGEGLQKSKYLCAVFKLLRTAWWTRDQLCRRVRWALWAVLFVQGLETLLLAMLSHSVAGAPLLRRGSPAMCLCQVGCIAHTSWHSLLERSIFSVMQTKASCALAWTVPPDTMLTRAGSAEAGLSPAAHSGWWGLGVSSLAQRFPVSRPRVHLQPGQLVHLLHSLCCLRLCSLLTRSACCKHLLT